MIHGFHAGEHDAQTGDVVQAGRALRVLRQAAAEQLRRQIKGYLDEAAKAQAEASELKREVFRLQQRLESRNNGQNRQNNNGGNGR